MAIDDYPTNILIKRLSAMATTIRNIRAAIAEHDRQGTGINE